MIDAALVCMLADGTPVRDGARVRLADNVTCEIHLAGKSDPLEHPLFEARITARKLHARPNTLESHRDVKKIGKMTYGAEAAFFKGVDFEPCDDMVFRAQIDSDKDNLWSAEIHTRSTCARPTVAATATCVRGKTHVDCTVTASHPPKDLRVTAISALAQDPLDAPLANGTTKLALPIAADPPCEWPSDVYVEITLPDGRWVWSRTVELATCRGDVE